MKESILKRLEAAEKHLSKHRDEMAGLLLVNDLATAEFVSKNVSYWEGYTGALKNLLLEIEHGKPA